MRRSLITFAAVAVLLITVTAAVAVILTGGNRETSAARSHAMLWSAPGAPSSESSDSPAWGAGRGGSMQGIAVDSELQYLAHMVAHHQEAIAASSQLRRSERPQMRAFGRSIAFTQSAQIDRMNSWLAARYPGRSTTVDYQPMMPDLSVLSGDQLDRVFLQRMIWHHMVAVMMSEQLLARDLGLRPEVDRLAVSIRDGQHAEIVEMGRMLDRWYRAGWMMHGQRWRHWNQLMGDRMHDRGWDHEHRDAGNWHMGARMMR
jgi:uncharacterized protein (DUF305 family)